MLYRSVVHVFLFIDIQTNGWIERKARNTKNQNVSLLLKITVGDSDHESGKRKFQEDTQLPNEAYAIWKLLDVIKSRKWLRDLLS